MDQDQAEQGQAKTASDATKAEAAASENAPLRKPQLPKKSPMCRTPLRRKLMKYQRLELDRRLDKWVRAGKDRCPARGWLHMVRGGLGLTADRLAALTGLSARNIRGIERSEADGTIKLETLRRVAKAMQCELVYAVVPHKSLAETLRGRAFAKVVPQIILLNKSSRSKLSDREIIELTNAIIENSKMLDDTDKLWDANEEWGDFSLRDALEKCARENAMHQAWKEKRQASDVAK
ncbi:MAG: helix-turn-helix domain-containing protein [Bdellovibrionales bacterium]